MLYSRGASTTTPCTKMAEVVLVLPNMVVALMESTCK